MTGDGSAREDGGAAVAAVVVPASRALCEARMDSQQPAGCRRYLSADTKMLAAALR